MHPAWSIILFTSLSGLGFGLMIFLGLGFPAVEGWVAGVFAVLALGLAGVGLLFSTAHLGNPQRAWRAFSQWRSSWLSREGISAVAAMAVFALYAAIWVFGDGRIAALGALASALALATVFCTAMIYAQMKTVPRWRHWSTAALFVAYALAGGALLSSLTDAAALLIAAAFGLQIYAWTRGDGAFAASGSDIGTATGLGGLGAVRLLEPPHTGSNYLMSEMIHIVGRRRARQLRLMAILLGGVIPALLLLFLEALPAKHAMAGVALLAHLAGVLAARWLFFAEAEHVVGLYYDKRRV